MKRMWPVATIVASETGDRPEWNRWTSRSRLKRARPGAKAICASRSPASGNWSPLASGVPRTGKMARGGAAEALDGVLYLARYHPELVEIKYPTCCRTKLRMVPLLCHCSRPPIFSS